MDGAEHAPYQGDFQVLAHDYAIAVIDHFPALAIGQGNDLSWLPALERAGNMRTQASQLRRRHGVHGPFFLSFHAESLFLLFYREWGNGDCGLAFTDRHGVIAGQSRYTIAECAAVQCRSIVG